MERIENPRLAALYEKYNDLIFEIALVKLQDQELKQFETPMEEAEAREADAFFERTQQRTLSVIARHLRGRQIKHVLVKTLPRVGIVSASILLIFFLSLTTAIATVKPVREGVLKLIMEIDERYTTISLSPDDGHSIDVPEEWTGAYFPNYLPDGYECKGITTDLISVIFEKTPTGFMRFTECKDANSIRFDTEDSVITDIMLNETPALMFECDDIIQITWHIDDSLFKISTNIDSESAIRVAKSVGRIK